MITDYKMIKQMPTLPALLCHFMERQNLQDFGISNVHTKGLPLGPKINLRNSHINKATLHCNLKAPFVALFEWLLDIRLF